MKAILLLQLPPVLKVHHQPHAHLLLLYQVVVHHVFQVAHPVKVSQHQAPVLPLVVQALAVAVRIVHAHLAVVPHLVAVLTAPQAVFLLVVLVIEVHNIKLQYYPYLFKLLQFHFA